MANRFSRWLGCSIIIMLSVGMAPADLFGALANQNVTLRITDASGKPVRSVTVLAIQNLPKKLRATNLPRPDARDMARIARRYSDSFYYIIPSHNIIEDIQLVGLTNKLGKVVDNVIFEIRNKKTMKEALISYAFFKHGYAVKLSDVAIKKSYRYREVTVVLEKSSKTPGSSETESIIQTEFDDIRFTVENIRAHLSLSLAQHRALESAREKLMQLASKAETENFPKYAARILAWIRYMPEVVLDSSGRPYKYSQMKPGSQRNLAVFRRAFELHPSSPYLHMESLYNEGAEISMLLLKNSKNKQVRKQFASYLNDISDLLAQNSESVWPYAYVAIVGGYERLGKYKEAYTALEKARRFEPYYLDYDDLMKDMKLREQMKLFK